MSKRRKRRRKKSAGLASGRRRRGRTASRAERRGRTPSPHPPPPPTAAAVQAVSPAKVIVFPVWPDLGSLIGDDCDPGGDVPCPAARVGLTGGETVTGDDGACPSLALPAPRLSYSVSYFSWSVSEDSDEETEEGLAALASRLQRVQIRRSSRERNELRSAAQISLRLPPPPSRVGN